MDTNIEDLDLVAEAADAGAAEAVDAGAADAGAARKAEEKHARDLDVVK